jgi:hypothetical protein
MDGIDARPPPSITPGEVPTSTDAHAWGPPPMIGHRAVGTLRLYPVTAFARNLGDTLRSGHSPR